MITMLETITPKSDQLNADDLIGGMTKIIKITKTSIAMGEQPVSIHFEGDNGKPYKPGKSMRRVLVAVWGADANVYTGRYLTLYNDEKVTFGGVETGGIRISHMSHIDRPITVALTASKAKRKPFTVKPLNIQGESTALSEKQIYEIKEIGRSIAEDGLDELRKWWVSLGGIKHKQIGGGDFLSELKVIASQNEETTEILKSETSDSKPVKQSKKKDTPTQPDIKEATIENPISETILPSDEDNFYPDDF